MIQEIRNLTVNYETKGNGETVVFVHGLGGSMNVWQAQVGVCSRYFKTLAYDLRGSGRTETSVPEYSMELWVEDLRELLDHQSIESAHLVGHSMGTLIIQHFAVTYPERVKSLSLVGGMLEVPEAGKRGLYDRAALVREKGMDSVADVIIEAGTSSYSKYTNPGMVGLTRELIQRNDAQGYAASCKALADGKAIDHSSVKVPVLLIVGDEDRTTPLPMAKKLLRAFPDSRLEVVENCGHWTPIEAPEAVNRSLTSFLFSI